MALLNFFGEGYLNRTGPEIGYFYGNTGLKATFESTMENQNAQLWKQDPLQ